MSGRAWLAALALAAAPASLDAQGLAERVARVGEGTARVTYATRDDVEVCAEGIRMGEHRVWWRSNGWDDRPSECRSGSVEVELRVRAGAVRDVEVLRRRSDRSPGATDLGTVPADEAADFLLRVARTGGSGRGLDEALMPAMLADVEDVWRELLDIGRDPGVRGGVRKGALFWLGQEAADAATEGLADVAFDEDEDQEVREAAVFALSRRPDGEGIPVLMEVARTAREAGTRRAAMFWLAQSEDERVLDFFEEILLRRSGR